jgi:hypothetical protein
LTKLNATGSAPIAPAMPINRLAQNGAKMPFVKASRSLIRDGLRDRRHR